MSFFSAMFGAKLGAIAGGILLGPPGLVIGAKVGGLIGSGGNPLGMVGLDGLDGIEASSDVPTDVHGNPIDNNAHGGRPGNVHGNPPVDAWGNPR